MAVTVKVWTPEPFGKFFDREIAKPMKQAVTIGVDAATEGLKLDLRKAVHAAGLGERLGRAIRSNTYPDFRRRRVFSFGAAGQISFMQSKSKHVGGADEILAALNEGVTIAPTGGGKALAIPLRTVPKVRNRHMRPREVEAYYGRPLNARPTDKPGVYVLYLELTRTRSRRGRGGQWRVLTERRSAQGRKAERVDMFILVTKVQLARRLDFDRVARDWASRIPDLIDRAGARER